MRYLLDTHAAIWAVENDPRLSATASAIITRTYSADLAISDITLLEIALLLKKGRLKTKNSTEEQLELVSTAFTVLPISAEIAAKTSVLKLPQEDPFDRVIVATAFVHDLILLSKDRQITDANAVPVVW